MTYCMHEHGAEAPGVKPASLSHEQQYGLARDSAVEERLFRIRQGRKRLTLKRPPESNHWRSRVIPAAAASASISAVEYL